MTLPPFNLAILQNIGTMEWIIILVIMLLLFGRRLPEVGKSLGKGIVEFKRGLKGVEDEIDHESSKPASKKELPGNPYASADSGKNPYAGGGAERTVSRSENAEG
ncbi:MAG: twin-arginine translocase TatA/TatE family subunit [Phycisphaerae bacterium]|nr:twin-arginine translocase TatA/TatE family subunit [Phycisphaerae bacterium]